jgi:hydrogenase expression/formation protein HypC
MCVAAAGMVVSLDGDWAKVDVLGNLIRVHIGFVQPKVGDWVLVHAGYAMQLITPEAAREIASLHEEIGGML